MSDAAWSAWFLEARKILAARLWKGSRLTDINIAGYFVSETPGGIPYRFKPAEIATKPKGVQPFSDAALTTALPYWLGWRITVLPMGTSERGTVQAGIDVVLLGWQVHHCTQKA